MAEISMTDWPEFHRMVAAIASYHSDFKDRHAWLMRHCTNTQLGNLHDLAMMITYNEVNPGRRHLIELDCPTCGAHIATQCDMDL